MVRRKKSSPLEDVLDLLAMLPARVKVVVALVMQPTAEYL